MVPSRRRISCATSRMRPRAASRRVANADSSAGSGSIRQVRSRVTATNCSRNSFSVPSEMNCSASSRRPGSFSMALTCAASCRRTGAPCRLRCSARALSSVSKAVRRTLSPMSTSAGKPTVVPAPTFTSISSGRAPKVQAVRPANRRVPPRAAPRPRHKPARRGRDTGRAVRPGCAKSPACRHARREAEIHEQVRPQFARAEGVERQLHGQVLLGGAGQGAHQGLVEVMVRVAEIGGEFVERLQAVAVFLLQRLQQRQHLLLEQARHQPFAAIGRQLVERRQRQGQRHAVVGRAGIVVVGELEAAGRDARTRAGRRRW
jgi:hypothetical protein